MLRARPGGREWPRCVGAVGLISGIVLAVATRASWGARSKLLESISWEGRARLLSELNPAPPVNRSPSEPRRPNLEPVENTDRYEQLYGSIPVRPDGVSRAWGVNSFAQLLVHSGEFL